MAKLKAAETFVLEGRRKRVIGYFAYYFLTCVSLGLVTHFLRKFKRLKYILISTRCNLGSADHLIATNNYGESIYVPIKRVNVSVEEPELAKYIKNGTVRMVEVFCRRLIFDHTESAFVYPKILDVKKYYDYVKLSPAEDVERRLVSNVIYGDNDITVHADSISHIILQNLFSPFALYSTFCIVLWFRLNFQLYASALLIISAYIVYREISSDFEERKAKKLLESQSKIMRRYSNGEWRIIDSRDIVPGDVVLVDLEDAFPCDIRLLDGEVIVDESFLTGEVIPVCKGNQGCEKMAVVSAGTKIMVSRAAGVKEKLEKAYRKSLLEEFDLYCEKTKMVDEYKAERLKEIESKHLPAIGIVTATGFRTIKGLMIRNLLVLKPIKEEFRSEGIRLVIGLALIGAIISLCSFFYYRGLGIERSMSFDFSTDLFITIVAPILFVSLKLGTKESEMAMKKRKVNCNDPSRINITGGCTVTVFDKTGTLTETELELEQLDTLESILKRDSPYPMKIRTGLATCHSVINVDNQYLGDSMEIKMIEFSRAILATSKSVIIPEIRENKKNRDFQRVEPTETIEEENSYLPENIIEKEEYNYETGLENYNITLLDDPYQNISNDTNSSEIDITGGTKREIYIENLHPFNSNVMRMSVVVSENNKRTIFTKGSPESLLDILKEVPEGYDKRISEYTSKGYRVLVLGYKDLDENIPPTNFHSIGSIKNPKDVENFNPNEIRLEHEKDLNFLSLLIFTNKLKERTVEVIEELKEAERKIVISTGDDALTTISIAKKAGIVSESMHYVHISLDGPNLSYTPYGPSHRSNSSISPYLNSDILIYNPIHHTLSCGGQTFPFFYSCTGRAYEKIREDPDLHQKILRDGKIFSRMSPTDKKLLMEDFTENGECTLFCGDGANDCGALKAADIGVTISDNEATITSPFVSKVPDISAVKVVLGEGRAAMVTALCNFKHIISTSLSQYITLSVLSLFIHFLSDLQTLHYDLFIVLPGSIIMTSFHTSKFLSRKNPKTKLLTKNFIIPVLTTTLINSTFVIALILMQLFPQKTTPTTFQTESPTSTMVFFLTAFQGLITTIIMTEGPPHRENKWKKKSFTLYVAISILLIHILALILYFSNTFTLCQWITKKYEFIRLTRKETIRTITCITLGAIGLITFEIIYNKKENKPRIETNRL